MFPDEKIREIQHALNSEMESIKVDIRQRIKQGSKEGIKNSSPSKRKAANQVVNELSVMPRIRSQIKEATMESLKSKDRK